MATVVRRETSEGDIHYKVVIRLKGYPTQTATFKKKTDAQRWAQSTESAIRENRHFKTAESKRRTFADMVDRYLQLTVPIRFSTRTAQKNAHCHLTWWKNQLGPYSLAEVTPSRIAELRDRLLFEPTLDSDGEPVRDKKGKVRKTKSPATVVRYLASLSTMYTTVANEWEWISENPVKRVKRPTESRGRVRFLSEDERDELLATCQQSSNSLLYPIVVLALSTGARQGEILSIEWPQVDFARNVIRLEHTKNNERRALPLVGHAYELMRELYSNRRFDTHLAFPRPDGKKPVYIVNDWNKALATAGIEDFRFHDLRHTAASYLAMNGATLAEIAEVLGHKTLQMVKRYAHLSEQHTASVVKRMNEKMFPK